MKLMILYLGQRTRISLISFLLLPKTNSVHDVKRNSRSLTNSNCSKQNSNQFRNLVVSEISFTHSNCIAERCPMTGTMKIVKLVPSKEVLKYTECQCQKTQNNQIQSMECSKVTFLINSCVVFWILKPRSTYPFWRSLEPFWILKSK